MTDPRRNPDPRYVEEADPDPPRRRRDPRRALAWLVLGAVAVAIVILALLVAPPGAGGAQSKGVGVAGDTTLTKVRPSWRPEVAADALEGAVAGQAAPSPSLETDGGGVAGLPPTDTLASLRDGRTGVIAQAVGHGADYLAIPIGPGKLVKLCGPGGCLTLTSTDAGPNHERLVAGRIADVAIGHWRIICGLPDYRGTCRGSWRVVSPTQTLPPTDSSDGAP